METAVEKLFSDLLSGKITDVLINQDKYIQLEKQQHENTWFDSTAQFDNAAEMTNKKTFDDYYTETYK